MTLYELADVSSISGEELGDDWQTRIGRKGYFVGEVDVDLCMMFSYRVQGDFWGFISAPVRSVDGIVNTTDVVIKTDNVRYQFSYAETHDD